MAERMNLASAKSLLDKSSSDTKVVMEYFSGINDRVKAFLDDQDGRIAEMAAILQETNDNLTKAEEEVSKKDNIIGNLDDRIDELKSEIEALHSKNATQADEMRQLEMRNSELEISVKNLHKERDELETEIERLKNKASTPKKSSAADKAEARERKARQAVQSRADKILAEIRAYRSEEVTDDTIELPNLGFGKVEYPDPDDAPEIIVPKGKSDETTEVLVSEPKVEPMLESESEPEVKKTAVNRRGIFSGGVGGIGARINAKKDNIDDNPEGDDDYDYDDDDDDSEGLTML